MKYLLTTKTADGEVIDRRSVYARDKAHLQNLKSELRVSATEIDEINRNCKELTPEEKLINEETMRSLQ